MKNIRFIFLFCISLVSAQNVVLNQVVATNTNTDKVFYKIDPEMTNSEYLAEIEVQGFSDDDVHTFDLIYKKAKQIGANAFAFKPFESVAQLKQPFDASHYKLSLFYVQTKDFPQENDVVYLISSPHNKQTIAINDTKEVFPPRTFKKLSIDAGKPLSISTRKLLGSRIQLSNQPDQPVQFFQLSAFSVNSNPYGKAGINLKSGDITRLEQSFGQFLTTIYAPLD